MRALCIGKIVTTRCVFSAGKCAKMLWRQYSNTIPRPPSWIKGPTSKGRGGDEREGKGGKCPPSEILKTPLVLRVLGAAK